MNRNRTRSSEPVVCSCTRTRHKHGTPRMYQHHRCGCDACVTANTKQRAAFRAANRPPAPEPPPPPRVDLFVATFPYGGGFSRQRLARALRPEVARLAEAQGVRLLDEELQLRIDRTVAGKFVVVAMRAESERPAGEVRARAAEFAYEHERAHPRLARWVSKHIEEAA